MATNRVFEMRPDETLVTWVSGEITRTGIKMMKEDAANLVEELCAFYGPNIIPEEYFS